MKQNCPDRRTTALGSVNTGENVKIITLEEANAQGAWQRSPVKAGFSKQTSRRVIRADFLDEEQWCNFRNHGDRNILARETLQVGELTGGFFLKIPANHGQQKCGTKQQT